MTPMLSARDRFDCQMNPRLGLDEDLNSTRLMFIYMASTSKPQLGSSIFPASSLIQLKVFDMNTSRSIFRGGKIVDTHAYSN